MRDIRRRIKSVKNTAQITKAMQMVAASKMRKAQQAALNGRPYGISLNRVLVTLRDKVEAEAHPLLERRDGPQQVVVLLTTDKGLCGALNTNLCRESLTFDKDQTQFVSIGRKGTQFLARLGRKIVAEFPLHDSPAFLETRKIANFLIEKYLAKECDRVIVLFPRFVNTLSQVPTALPLLPITSLAEAGLTQEEKESTSNTELLIEPHPAQVLDTILPFYVHFELHQLILSTRASEHSARMVAMKSATDNARQLVKDLTLDYNKARQASITKEILEIATAQLALS